jgi:uncharacterized protein (DUF2267 family)
MLLASFEMDEEIVVSHVRRLGGFAGSGEARRAIRATLTAIGERLLDDERAAFARELPSSLALVFERCAYDGDFDKDEFFGRVARHERVERGFGAEHAQVVCQALGEALGAEAMTRLRKELGPEIASLFDAQEPIESLPRTARSAGSTLASGREGSRHPMSEARPDYAHVGSVARSTEPHAETKLSSARGLAQERSGETLATGHPGAKHPVDEGKR